MVEVAPEKKQQKKRKRSSNIEAVLLHVMGDALGSVAAITSALIIRYVPADQEWRFYADPVCSLLIVILILQTCVPLFKSVCGVLLQTAPKSINVTKLRDAISAVPGVTSFHGLHVWQLNDDIVIGSVHVVCDHERNHQKVMDDVKAVFTAPTSTAPLCRSRWFATTARWAAMISFARIVTVWFTIAAPDSRSKIRYCRE